MEQGFFPLDEVLQLQPGSLTPLQQEHLAHFASSQSFAQAAKMLLKHHGVQISASTSRRQTEEIGASAEQVQNEQAKAAYSKKDSKTEHQEKTKEPEKLVISNDGAFISLREKDWAEVKTMAIGEVEEKKKSSKQRPNQEVKLSNLSYFSRLADVDTLSVLVTGELEYRGFFQAKTVAAIQDGAEWIQSLLDVLGGNAVRILDFYHAADYLKEIAQLLKQAGIPLTENWVKEQLHELKRQGPRKVLEEIKRLSQNHPPGEDFEKKVRYLDKREEMMCYPSFQQQGLPIGSGSVESANVGVVQARLKGPGMHWERKNVNSMLALRLGVCNERWEETRDKAFHERLETRKVARFARKAAQYEKIKQKTEEIMVRILLLASPSPAHQKDTSSSPLLADRVSSPVSASPASLPIVSAPPSEASKSRIPAPSHPWRRYSHAKN